MVTNLKANQFNMTHYFVGDNILGGFINVHFNRKYFKLASAPTKAISPLK